MIDKNIYEKLHQIGIDVEYKESGDYPAFRKKYAGKKILLLCDQNTLRYAKDLKIEEKQICFIDQKEPIPDESVCTQAIKEAEKSDYILAVGSGTLNDVAKYTALTLKKKSGVLATAPSMDGYASPVAAIMRNGFKVSKEAHAPSDILIDAKILAEAPSEMIAAGAGDILGKYTCLTDWRLAQFHTGEKVNEVAFGDILDAVDKFSLATEDIIRRDEKGIEKLTDALIISGLAMAESGNSRPASGAEHHILHYLEMWFVAQKKCVPLHGIKVGLGTLVSAYLYKTLEKDGVSFVGDKETYQAAGMIPSVESLRKTLMQLGAPIRFSELKISSELFRETIMHAYTVRSRYTILTLLHELGLIEHYLPKLEELFY